MFCTAGTITAGACALVADRLDLSDRLDLWVPLGARTAFLGAGAFAALTAVTFVPGRRVLRSASEASRRLFGSRAGGVRAPWTEQGFDGVFYLLLIAVSIGLGLAVARLAS